MSKLQESLNLTDQQFAEMVVAQKRVSEHRQSYRRTRSRTLQELRRLLGEPDVPDDVIASQLALLDELQESFNATQREDYEAIDEILDLRQRAKYRLLEQEIQARFQEMVREIRRVRSPEERRPK
jgi:hypothetical protein